MRQYTQGVCGGVCAWEHRWERRERSEDLAPTRGHRRRVRAGTGEVDLYPCTWTRPRVEEDMTHTWGGPAQIYFPSIPATSASSPPLVPGASLRSSSPTDAEAAAGPAWRNPEVSLLLLMLRDAFAPIPSLVACLSDSPACAGWLANFEAILPL